MSTKKKNRRELVESALAGGLIGAALGALLTGKSKGAIVSALVGAAIGASLKAIDEATEINMPVLYEEEGVIYKIYPDGSKEMVKKINRYNTKIPLSFSIE